MTNATLLRASKSVSPLKQKTLGTLTALAFLLCFAQSLLAQVPTNGLQLWLKADTLTGSDGTPVASWPAVVGPSAASSGVHIPMLMQVNINGQPKKVVRFLGNGSSTKDQPLMVVQGVSTGSNVTAFAVFANTRPGTPPLQDQTVDVLMATKNDYPTTGFGISSYNSYVSRDGREIRAEGGTLGSNGTATIKKNRNAAPTLEENEFVIMTFKLSGVQNTGGSGSPLVINALRDSMRSGRHDIAEILLYDRILNLNETVQVENYLAQKYNFVLPPPPREDGLLVWLKADGITGLNDGDSVSTWPGFDNTPNATSTGIYRPTFVTNRINGKPVVRFTGNGGTTKDQPLMKVDVATESDATAIVVLANRRSGNPPLPPNTVDVVLGTKTDYPATGFAFSTYNSYVSQDGRRIHGESGIGNNGTPRIRKNGSETSRELGYEEFAIVVYELKGVTNTLGSGSPLILGALRDSVRAGSNDIAEVIIYGRTLSELELDEIELYLSNKYNIPLVRPPISGIPSNGLELWLKLESSNVTLTGQPANIWLDASGARNHMRSAGDARPTIANNGTQGRGFVVMRFDGVNDTMATALPLTGNATVFAVAANRRSTINPSSPEGLLSNEAGYYAMSNGGTRQFNVVGGSGTATLSTNGVAGSPALSENQFAILTSTLTGIGNTSRIRLGSLIDNTGYGQNDIAEVLVYNRVLSASEIAQVEQYLSLKYNIGVPANTAPQSVVLDDFSVSDTLLNGWSVLDIFGGEPTRDRYTLNWVTDEGQPALKIGTSGLVGINGLPQGRTDLPGGLPDTLGGGRDAIRKYFKSSATDTTPVNLSRAKVLHVIAKTDAENTNRFQRDIAPTLSVILTDATRPPYVFPNGDTLYQRRATNGGRRYSNEPERMVTLIADGKYHEYIFDFTNNFRGLDYGNVFGFGVNAAYTVDSTQIEYMDITVNPGLIAGMTYRHNFDDPDREARVVGNRGPDNVGGDYIPVYTTSAPRFVGDIFIRSIVANDDPIPVTNRRSTSATPSVASGAAGEGTYILGNTNAFIEIQRGSTTDGSISASVGTIAPEPVFSVNDTVGIHNVYRINDGDGNEHFVIPGRVWTINQTGLSASTRFDISIYCGALTGIVRPQNLYIAYRPNASSPWKPLTTYRDGDYLKAFNLSGNEFGQFAIASKTIRNPLAQQLSVQKTSNKAKSYTLSQNYPNPFNPTTTIRYSIANAGNVSLKIYDILGREVATLVNGRQAAGEYTVQFNATNLASGIYFYRLQAGDFVQTRKMMLVK
ncbi:MAG: T9SS type A sorting domain-containing protein [Chloroherpetonaceae bacterium]